MNYKLLLFTFFIMSWSCTTKIDLDSVYEKNIVIEGSIEQDSVAEIKISQTVSATGADSFPPVENAIVRLKDTEGNEEILIEKISGIYKGSAIKGMPGDSYELFIETEDNTFFSKTNQPFLTVAPQFLSLDTTVFDTDGAIVQELVLNFDKLKSDSIYCQFDVFYNGVAISPSVFYKNEIAEQQNIDLRLTSFFFLNSNDLISVEITQMEQWLYEYLQEFEDKGNSGVISGLLIGPPDNLVGNMEGGALGYFGATSKTYVEIIIP